MLILFVYEVNLEVWAIAELLVMWAVVEMLVIYWCYWFVNMWRWIPWKYVINTMLHISTSWEIISYQILLKHQVFIVCIIILFQIVLFVFFLDLNKTFHVTEMRGIIINSLLISF